MVTLQAANDWPVFIDIVAVKCRLLKQLYMFQLELLDLAALHGCVAQRGDERRDDLCTFLEESCWERIDGRLLVRSVAMSLMTS